MNLQCTRCGAPLVMPADYAVWGVRCQYCGFDCELPDRAARQAYAERQRAEAQRAAQAEQAAATQQAAIGKEAKTKRTFYLAIFGGTALVVLLGTAIPLYLALSSTASTLTLTPTPTTVELPAPPALVALGAKGQASGCPRVIDTVSIHKNEYKGSYGLVKAECIRFLGVAVQPGPLSLTITDPTGKVVWQPPAATPLDSTYCANTSADHQVKISGSPEFWIASLGCPRTFGSDPETTGKAKVAARLKDLMSHGCYQISYANSTFTDDRKFTTTLEAGLCMDLIAATGVPDNELKAAFSSPFGEAIAPMPAAATSLEVGYCAVSAGPHVIELTSALEAPFSAAIAICTRKALPKDLPKASK